mmetsp:Transcript_50312/g.113030  ORF Transcript_50312/g.113030 Transcript_50312/m.113030 type:complete len:225 (+) Transcript_50312:1489-2163(+)
MEPEHLRGLRVYAWHRLDRLDVVVARALCRYAVVDPLADLAFGLARLRLLVLKEVKRLEGVKEEIAQVLLHIRPHHAPVAVVRDAPAVHDLADEVAQRVPRDLGVVVRVCLGEVVVQQSDGHREVGVVEVVTDIPAHLAVLAPLLHHGVEEGEDEDARAEGGVRAGGERLLVHLGVGGEHVEAETVWRLGDHLDRALQDANRELRVGRGGEPEPERRMRLSLWK